MVLVILMLVMLLVMMTILVVLFLVVMLMMRFFRYSLGKGDDLYSLKWYKDEVEFYRYDKICNHCEFYRFNI